MKHELKCWPQYFCRVADGSKTFEKRFDDRGFQSGDTVLLREWDPEPVNGKMPGSPAKGYTDAKPLEFTIGYILYLERSEVVFSLLPVKKAKSR
jgi:hypothetical protein